MADIVKPLVGKPGWNTAVDAAIDKVNAHDGALSALTSTVAGKVAKGELFFNVRDYGAVGDGTTDDTAAFQSAINAAITANGVLRIPGVTYGASYRITNTLTIASPDGTKPPKVSIEASGYHNALEWDGGSNKPMFYAPGGWAGCYVRGLNIQVRAGHSGVKVWDLDTSLAFGFCNSISFDRCAIALNTGANNVGYRLGHLSAGGADISFIQWTNCSVAGGGTSGTVTVAGQRGWISEGPNTLNLSWFGGLGSFLEKMITNVSDSGAASAQGGGSLFAYGLGGGYNGTDWEIGNLGTYLISGGRYELGKRLVEVTYGGTSPGITLVGLDVSDYTPTNGRLVSMLRPAKLHMQNCMLNALSSDYGSQTIFGGGPASGTIVIEGGGISATDPFCDIYPGDVAWDITLRNVGKINRDNHETTGRYADRGAAVPLKAGALTTTDLIRPGQVGVDSTNNRLYVNVDGTMRYVTLT